MVAYSDELPRGGVQPLHYFGQDLVLYRTGSGRAQAADAFCPHLGAHLGHGGRVDGEELVCPFHAWRFDCDGRCSAVPYAKRIPPQARLRTWPTVEGSGMIFVWHHARGEAPSFEAPSVPEWGRPEWEPWQRFRWKVRSASQEIIEGAVDNAHFPYVHKNAGMPGMEFEFDGPFLRTRASLHLPEGPTRMAVQFYGVGAGVGRKAGLGDVTFIGTETPIDDEHVDFRFSLMKKRGDPGDPAGAMAQFYIDEIARGVGEDIPIWESKSYQAKPLLCDGDGPIAQYRRWASQFYSE
jgi:nitrite reductase/ring-hydroxylating ferredoxin subunit